MNNTVEIRANGIYAAAGAIPPSEGFKYAFGNGADFICVGMYDFQIVEDVNVALAALGDSRERSRRWIV